VKHIIFYSWQSDLDPALTRNFIEDALTKAAKSLNRDENVSVEAVIDRDTSGVAGTPGISETIFQKIDECDVFVCDVSIANSIDPTSDTGLFLQIVRVVTQAIRERTFRYRRAKRPTPNPNVLLELGYAAARLGWDRMILVQNTAYGNLGDLPFDLRGRRIVPYDLSSKDSRADERPKLRDQLELSLRKSLTDMLAPNVWVGETMSRWFGFWTAPSRPTKANTLLIREVGAKGFLFHLSLTDGARAGSVTGFAKFTGPDSAYAFIQAAKNEKPCELKFRRAFAGKSLQVHVEETRGCNYYKGMGATFEGIYTCRRELLFDFGALDELDLQRLYSITGKYFAPLHDRFQQIGTSENDDKFVATVYTGGAKGLYLDFVGIVMKGERGQLWAAYTDDDVVRYFTTELDFKNKLPSTIERWRAPLNAKKVVYMTEIETIPSF